MAEGNRRLWKIISGIIAISLIFGILFVTNAFVGNPLSAKIAERKINKYMQKKYSSLDLEVDKPIYNFKDASYGVRVRSNTSVDTHFYVSYRSGEVYYDSYESDVLGRFNTLDRLSKEYSSLVSDMIANGLGYKNVRAWVHYDKDIYENPSPFVELDMKFDRELPIPARISINMEEEDLSLDEAARILERGHELFKKKRCYFMEYSLFSKGEKTNVNIMGLRPKDIERSDLPVLLKEALDREDDAIIEEGKDKDIEPEGILVDIIERPD